MTHDNILKAIKTLPKYKDPGVDGFPIEFFTQNWKIVKDDIVHVVQQFFIIGTLFPAINATIIT